MKTRKINFMKTPQITDDEIQRYKNFDAVLEQQQRQRSHPVRRLLPYSIGLLLLTLGTSWYYISQTRIQTEATTSTTSHPDSSSLRQDKPEATVPQEATTPALPQPAASKQKPGASPSASKKAASLIAGDSVMHQPATAAAAATQVYHEAEPVLGYQHLYEYFGRELRYPDAAVRDSIQGVVTVVFTITPQGKAEQIKILHSLGPLFDEEAFRLIQHMPSWQAATLNGKPVPSKISIPLTFQIQHH